jgi:Zn-dependent hydrolases, including glyoxylases
MKTINNLSKNVMLVPGILLVKGVGRLPMLTYIVRGRETALIDTGISSTPDEYILPFLKSQNISVKDISLCLITHAHFDHFGGNARMYRENNHIKFCAHENEYLWVEYHRRHFNEMYLSFEGEWYPDENYKNAILTDCGGDTPVRRILRNYDIVDLGEGIELQVVPTPSHSPGHVVYYCKELRVMICGDAIQGKETVFENGMKLMPLYHNTQQYLESLDTIKKLDTEFAYTSHEGILDRENIEKLINDSLLFADDLSLNILTVLKNKAKPLTLKELTEYLHEKYYFDCDYAYQIFATTHAQCEFLKSKGKLQHIAEDGHLKWHIC